MICCHINNIYSLFKRGNQMFKSTTVLNSPLVWKHFCWTFSGVKFLLLISVTATWKYPEIKSDTTGRVPTCPCTIWSSVKLWGHWKVLDLLLTVNSQVTLIVFPLYLSSQRKIICFLGVFSVSMFHVSLCTQLQPVFPAFPSFHLQSAPEQHCYQVSEQNMSKMKLINI